MNNYHSKDKPFIAKAFEANTCHITKNDDKLIKATCHAYKDSDVECKELIVHPYEEGCFIFADYDKSEVKWVYKTLKKEGYSTALINLLKIARFHGCKYLQLDCDGVQYDDLPTFKW
jgi:hypothetical protein